MQKKIRRQIILSMVFAVTIPVFGLFYWCTWLNRPDRFLVQQEVNLYPIDSIYGSLLTDKFDHNELELNGLAELSKEANQIIAKAKELQNSESQLRLESVILEGENKRLIALLEKNRGLRIEEYKRQELGPIEVKVELLKKQLDDSGNHGFSNGSIYTPLNTVEAELNVQLAEQNLILAKKKVEVWQKIVDEYSKFALVEDREAWEKVDSQLSALSKNLYDVTLSYSRLRGEASSLVGKWQKQRAKRLGFIDFIYFSLGIATTTTFGDIIPNHWIVRLAVFIQLIFSIIIVGLLINSLSILPENGGLIQRIGSRDSLEISQITTNVPENAHENYSRSQEDVHTLRKPIKRKRPRLKA